MATGEITTLPEDSGSGGFPPGNFKAPKRLYCKNGGYFLRIGSDGRVDGVREKHDPHSKCCYLLWLSGSRSCFLPSPRERGKEGADKASLCHFR